MITNTIQGGPGGEMPRGGRLAEREQLEREEAAWAAQVRAASLPKPKVEPQPPKAPEKPQDPFVAKYGKEPYYMEGRGFLLLPEHFDIASEISKINFVENSEQAVLDAESVIHKAVCQRRDDAGHDSANQKFAGMLAEYERKISAGEAPVIMPHRENVNRENEMIRAQCRAELKAIGVRVNPIYIKVADRISRAARAVVEQLDAQERSAAEKFKAPFYPSYQICLFVFMAMEGARQMLETAKYSTASSPDDFLMSIHPKTHKRK